MNERSKVYLLKPDAYREIPRVMEKAGIRDVVKENDFTAIKVHFGEKGNKGYIKPEILKPVAAKLKEITKNVFITDANTIYRGERTDAASHLMIAAEHGFHPKYLGIPVIIADGLRGNAEVEIDVPGRHFKKAKIAEAIYNSDVIVAISHFKGHEICGFGGAIKNLGMGCASRAGKFAQHNSLTVQTDTRKCTACGVCLKWCGAKALKLDGGKIALSKERCVGCGQCILACNFKVFSLPWNEEAGTVQEKVAEYAYGVLKNKRSFYINFLTFITEYCDCYKTKSAPLIPDIGILVSKDPVAIDQACMDLVEKHAGRDIFQERSGIDGSRQLDAAEKLGLGKRTYHITEVES